MSYRAANHFAVGGALLVGERRAAQAVLHGLAQPLFGAVDFGHAGREERLRGAHLTRVAHRGRHLREAPHDETGDDLDDLVEVLLEPRVSRVTGRAARAERTEDVPEVPRFDRAIDHEIEHALDVFRLVEGGQRRQGHDAHLGRTRRLKR